MSRLLIVTQCCKAKRPVEQFPNLDVSILNSLSNNVKKKLLTARERFSSKIYGSRMVTALSLYVGHEYEALNKRLVYDLYIKGVVDFAIISAGYGIVHAFEKIREYEAYMDREAVKTWISLGLPTIVADYITNTRPREVYGFFSKTSGYQEIYREVARHMPEGIETRMYIAYPESCKGIPNIMRALGYAINNLIKEGKIPSNVKRCNLIVERLR